jgi:DivIVA domain-containing protein
MRRKKAEDAGTPSSGQSRITPADVQQVEFRLAFRGYNERDVDAFLDRVTEDLAWYAEENRRLRDAGGAPAVSASVDAAVAGREAERILAEARTEAARIIGEAEARAAVLGASTGDARAAVAPFLTRERGFLQDLGALVQAHAEEVKEMVLTLRAKADETASGTPASPAVATPAGAPDERVTEEPTAAEPEEPAAAEPEEPVAAEPDAPAAAEPDAPAAAEPDASGPSEEDAFAPITVPEAEDDGAEAEEGAAATQLRRDSGERSLRELFWGED